jgi:hypothetical protein
MSTTRSAGRRSSPSRSPLLSLRSLVLLVVALLIGAVGGALTWLSTHSAPGAIFAGGATFGAALKLLHELVE